MAIVCLTLSLNCCVSLNLENNKLEVKGLCEKISLQQGMYVYESRGTRQGQNHKKAIPYYGNMVEMKGRTTTLPKLHNVFMQHM